MVSFHNMEMFHDQPELQITSCVDIWPRAIVHLRRLTGQEMNRIRLDTVQLFLCVTNSMQQSI
jgi:hypothetical protein